MRVTRITRLLLAAITALMALAPLSAFAVPPTRETVDTVVDRGVVGNCGDFDVTAKYYVTGRVTTFYDQDGTAVKRIRFVQFTGDITNTTTGETVAAKGVRVFVFDLVEGTSRDMGTSGHVVVPGMGTVVLAVRGDPVVNPKLCLALS